MSFLRYESIPPEMNFRLRRLGIGTACTVAFSLTTSILVGVYLSMRRFFARRTRRCSGVPSSSSFDLK